ncbi:MAG: hypothetical protein RSF82_09280 [Angelakisella sp.]
MEDNKIFLIPKNLNREYTLIGGYTMGDTVITLLLIAAGIAIAFFTKAVTGFIPAVVFITAKFRIEGQYTLFHWTAVTIKFLCRKATNKGNYYLFEKEAKEDWKC